TIIFPAANYISVAMLVSWMPNYASYMGIFMLADMLSSLVYSFTLNVTSPISEAYNNGKLQLTRDYIARNYQWNGISGSIMMGLLFAGAPLLGIIAGPRFELIVPMIRYLVLFKFIDLFAMLHDQIYNGLGHPEYNIILVGVDQGIRILVTYILLIPIPSSWLALVYALGIGRTAKWIVGFIILKYKFFKFKVNVWQSFVSPLIAFIIEFAFLWGIVYWLTPTIAFDLGTGEINAAIISILIGIVAIPFMHFTITILTGGWDDHGLEIFGTAVKMSGPSKPLMSVIFRLLKLIARVSPLHGRFAIKIQGVNSEIQDLMKTRTKKIGEYKASTKTR
ncbi:MAG: hypothetical protein ACTSRA_20705, partial [Promethearchaeota archaeon]